jgi:hypothetical protein
MNPENTERVQQEYLRHNQQPHNENVGLKLSEKIKLKSHKAKIITLVREPVGRNVSAFFQNYKRFTGSGFHDSYFEAVDLINMFFKNYNHEVPLSWFDIEIKETLDIDVYDYTFPKEKGFLAIQKGNIELLILKMEMSDAIKQKVISEFLNIGLF